ncbi:SWIM zinc finger domain protein [Nitzschia inconspicua]|uniref:SWIM zinc finger domain protein n=1 Tax=Nitzschia inconspicua TaxID=303405 RepID=A0A9K3LMP9_9STRA|nr:SWIM zinc finger domain protein [Nitzschia inconspicua]
MDSAWLEDETLPPRYGFRNSNISESANNMVGDARNGNWLDAIDGILIKMSLRIMKSQSEYEGKDGVVDNILGLATKRWENCVGCRVYASGNDGETYSVYQKLGGELEEEALLKVRPVDCVCDCGKWQAIGVPCVHGMAYFRHQMKWRLEDVLDQAVDEYYKYRTQRELYRRNFVPVWRHLLEPDMMTLPPDGAARRMPGRPKTVRLRQNSRYAHEPEKSPTICSRCHQPGHNVRTIDEECDQRQYHSHGVGSLTSLLGFLHGEHVVRRGVLIDDDFPPWVTVPLRAILKSRATLYFANLKLITMSDGTMKPTKPLLLYKHSAQHRYNKQNPGLDMNTELSDRVAFNSKGSFESKYVFRMMDAILVNVWRAHQAVFDIAPCLATLAEPPSLAQQFQKYKDSNVWPMRRGALEKFVKDPFLNRLRMASFPEYEHKSGLVHELVKKANEGARRKCILYFVSKKDVPEASRLHGKEVSSNSSFMCTICMVCLCKKRIGGSKAKSCYDVWHERKNLDLEVTKQRKRLMESREEKDPEAEKRRKNSAIANSQEKSPSKSPGPFQDAQFQDEEEQPDEDELVEEDQEDEQEGDKMDEEDIEAEE